MAVFCCCGVLAKERDRAGSNAETLEKAESWLEALSKLLGTMQADMVMT